LMVITAFPGVVVLREKAIIKYNQWKESRKGNQHKDQELIARMGTVQVGGSSTAAKSDPEDGAQSSKLAPQVENKKDLENADREDISVDNDKANMVAADDDDDGIVDRRDDRMSKFDRFCFKTYSTGLNKGRYIVVGFFVIWLIIAAIFTAQLTPPTESEEWIPDDHKLKRGLNAMDDYFPKGANDNAQKIFIIWGVDGLDKSGIDDPWDPTEVGEIVWDKTFNPSTQINQLRLKTVCDNLKSDEYANLVLDRNVHCFVDNFVEYLTSINLTYPVTDSHFVSHLKNFLNDDTYGAEDRNLDSIGIEGDSTLRYIFFRVIGKGDRGPKSVLHPRWERWETVLKNFNEGSMEGLNKAFHTSRWWSWYMTEETLVRNAIQGMLIAAAISFLILAVTTHNIILALYAIICIIGIVTSVMAIVAFHGWDFGTAESIAVVILIGFSVDYVVHICHAYVESHHMDKVRRTREALAKMAISIVGGAVTTFGDGCMLFFTTMFFFQKFAWIVTTTIFFALIWSLIFFPALLFIAGPQNETGDLKVMIKKLYHKYQESKRGKPNSN